MGGRLLLSVCTAAAALTALPRSAEPCSPGLPIDTPTIVPEDGATGIPTNSRVYVEWLGVNSCWFTEIELAVSVRITGGAEIVATVERFCGSNRYGAIITPETPLASDTSYEVLARPVPFSCAPGDPDCLDTPLEVMASFATGNASDTAAPVFGGLTDVFVSFDICTGDCTCDFDFERIIAGLGWSPATDATPESMIRYNVYRVGAAEPVERLTRWASRVEVCSGDDIEGQFGGGFYGEDGDYYVRAVDLAGNEDDNTVTRNITLDCSTLPADPDAGPIATPDASPAAPDAGANTDTPDDGCCAVADRNPASSIALAVLVLIALIRKQNSRSK